MSKKKSHTDVSDEANTQDENKLVTVHTNMGIATASIASTNVTGVAFSLYGMRFLFNAGMFSYGIAVSEGFPFVQEFHPIGSITNFTINKDEIASMNLKALNVQLRALESNLAAINARINALSVQV